MLHDFSWIDLTEPDPKHNGAAMRNERLAPIWKEQGNEMTGLFGRSCLKKVKRIELPMGTRVISSRFHYKIKRHSAGAHKLKVKRLKVRLVVQGQHMSKDNGDFTDDRYRTCLECDAACVSECCLLVLNLVSSTLPCIRRPRPRLRVLDVCGFV